MTPKETDTALAEVWKQIYETQRQLGYTASALLSLAGAEYYYRGRQRVTDMRLPDAIEKLTAAMADIAEYKATHSETEPDGWVRTDWREYKGLVAPYDADKPAKYLAEREKELAELGALRDQAAALEATYTGWSRFFLVT